MSTPDVRDRGELYAAIADWRLIHPEVRNKVKRAIENIEGVTHLQHGKAARDALVRLIDALD